MRIAEQKENWGLFAVEWCVYDGNKNTYIQMKQFRRDTFQNEFEVHMGFLLKSPCNLQRGDKVQVVKHHKELIAEFGIQAAYILPSPMFIDLQDADGNIYEVDTGIENCGWVWHKQQNPGMFQKKGNCRSREKMIAVQRWGFANPKKAEAWI